jgi:four helix bundle protein
VAFELALEVIESLRGAVAVVRRRDAKLAKQMIAAASSIAANVEEANRRTGGGDRLHLLKVAAGSAAETRAHLRVAMAWGWLKATDVEAPLALLDRELAVLWRLTH